MTIKAIETQYKGYRFRSRLEARWAVFFDALGLEWMYEPEGFDLDGIWYLPDFYLVKQDLWIEVKPTYPDKKEQDKAFRFAQESKKAIYIFFSDFSPEKCFYSCGFFEDPYLGMLMTRCYAFATCPSCKFTSVLPFFISNFHYAEEWPKEGELIDNSKLSVMLRQGQGQILCPCKEKDRELMLFDDFGILTAYVKARQARFEHGENPQ